MEFLSIDNNSRWFQDVQLLGDKYRSTLGFFTREAFGDYAKKKHIIVCIIDNTVAGYIMYRYKENRIIVVHLCVEKHYRNNNIAKNLLDFLCNKEVEKYSSIGLYCRRDYNLSRFWEKLGFIAITEKDGRATRKNTILTNWRKVNYRYSNLFDTDNKSDGRIAVAVDSNIIIGICSNECSEVKALSNDYLNNYIKYFVTRFAYIEFDRSENTINRRINKNYANSFCETVDCDEDSAEFKNIVDELVGLKSVEIYSNSWYDVKHIAAAIVGGMKIFVTMDLEWLDSEIVDYVFVKWGMHIMSPGELIRSIDEIDSPTAYMPENLAGLELTYSEMRVNEYETVAETFYHYYGNRRKNSFKQKLREWMASTKNYHIFCIRSKDGICCVVVYRLENNEQFIETILINSKVIKKSICNTFVKRLAFKLLELAHRDNVVKILINKNKLNQDIISAFEECKYDVVKDKIVKCIVNNVVDSNGFISVLENFKDGSIVNELGTKYLYCDDHNKKSIAFELEKRLWPMKLNEESIPCYVVPIQANYAMELFDEKLSNINISLFPHKQVEASLSIENVYFKSAANSIVKFPARILWYISNDNCLYGSKMIRATSYLDYVERGNAKDIYKKYKRLGVLSWDDMKNLGYNDKIISAYIFSYTELFDKPISIERVREILN